tara:strand:- start:111 stop:359 length:249 start_codon:yes stop_codon:yes gene_type:complete
MNNFNLKLDTINQEKWSHPVWDIQHQGGTLKLINFDGSDWSLIDYNKSCAGMDSIIVEFPKMEDCLNWLTTNDYKPMSNNSI